MCAYLQAVKLANYALKGVTGEDEVKMLKEKCVAKSTNNDGYDYAYYSCKEYTYGYMDETTFDKPCGDQLGMKVGGKDDYGTWSYDLCSLHGGAEADKTYGVGGAVAQSEKMVKQARDAKQQVTNDEAKNAEDKEDVSEAKKGRLHVYECSDAVEKKEAKDIYFCFVKGAGDRFFGDIESDWEGQHMVTIEKLDGTVSTSEEIEIEVWNECKGVTDSCGTTTGKNVEYFTKNEKYVLLKKGAEKKDDDSEGDDGEDDKTVTYEELEKLKYAEDIEKTIAKCEGSDSGICKLVSNENFREVMQPIIKQEAKDAANEEEKKLDEKRKQMEQEKNEILERIAAEDARKQEEETQRLKTEIDYYTNQNREREAEKEYEALKKNEQELIIEENEQELIEGQRQRLINLEKYETGMNNGAPVVETGSQ